VSDATGTPQAARRIPLVRWAALGGIAYVVLFVIAALVAHGGTPDSDASPTKVVSYYQSGSHRDKIALAGFLAILGVFFFLWFLAALRQAVRRLAGDGVLGMVTTVGGAVYAALTLVAFSIYAGVRTMSDDTYKLPNGHREVYPGLIHAADDVWYVMHSAGGVAVGAMMIAASLATLATTRMPRWAAWLGVLAGVSAIVSIFLIPWFVIAVWLVIASVIVFRAHVEEDATY
jgi:hypothetical protein